ncbi:aromatic amino acid lyase [Capnocytophaga canis]|uniref:aromatic amino acid lyase n=1 Tax=Capnocytophaga canis TaxID=1848903 RepID=UPI0037D79368
MNHYISNDTLFLENIENLLIEDVKLKLSEEAKINIQKSQDFLSRWSLEHQKQNIPNENADFQCRLLKSYACGVGTAIPDEVVKLMLFLKIQSFCYGFSGIRLEIIERFLDFFNYNVLPVVYSKDTPDDRISLAHLSLPLIGEGEVRIKGKIFSSCELEEKFGWKPLHLKEKEAEILLGGTQLTTAYGAFNMIKALKLCELSDFIASVSSQVFGVSDLFFSEQVQIVRPHKGQIQTAESLRKFLKNNEINVERSEFDTAPEAFRAIPQVHGAVKDTVAHVRKVIKTEINSVTDNLLVFSKENQLISSGNSHTLPLSLGLDFLAIALTSLGNMSERRIFHLISSREDEKEDFFLDLSVFQRITESILAENKRLSTPVSVESPIFTEKTTDIKGMGGSSAVKCLQVIENIEQILAVELLVAVLWSINQKMTFTSSVLNEYIDYLELRAEKISLKKSIEKTIQFFKTEKNEN